jgi:hypothetical protein
MSSAFSDCIFDHITLITEIEIMFKNITGRRVILLVFIAHIVLISSCVSEKPSQRTLLKELTDKYLNAVVAGDPSGLPLSRSVKFTEDTQVKKIGEGLWVEASEAPSTFKIYAIDTVSNQIGFYGVMKENDKPIILALRLKMENSQITEVEHVIARQISEKGMKNLVAPRQGFIEPVPSDHRDTRDRMYEIANLYFEAIEKDDGSIAPFADDCVRHENGTQTTTNEQPDPADFGDSPEEQLRLTMARVDACGCAKQIDAQNLSYITRIWPRRLNIIDEKLGLVFGFPMFVHKGDVQFVKIIGVPGVDTIPKKFPPFNLQAGEIFKISGGKIHEIEANGMVVPYGAGNGWDE